MNLCKEQPSVVIVMDVASAEQSLAAGSMSCPSCSGGSLRPWGFARSRVLRGLRGARLVLRPRRARCRACGATHVLLLGDAPPRRADTVQVVLSALLAHHGGAGAGSIAADLGVPVDTVRSWAGSIAADLGVPVDTVRSWLRTVTGRADWLCQEATR